MGVQDIMNIALTSLTSQQQGIEVTSHNVANINTNGYAKQTAMLNTSNPTTRGGLLMGMGVTVTAVRRAEDSYLNRNLYLGQSQLGYYSTKGQGLSDVEEVMNEVAGTTGISAAMSDFWSAWSDLANNPDGSAERANLQGMATVLCTRFHTTVDQLKLEQDNLNVGVKATVSEINSILQQLADNNVKIQNVEAAGQDAGDYRTTRTTLMNSLSELIDFTYFESDDGAINMSTGNGRTLVESGMAGQLEVRNNASNSNLFDVYFVSATGQAVNITNELEGGELAGYITVRDGVINDTLEKLDEMAYTIATEVNALHVTGYAKDGNVGYNFFAPLTTATNAASLISLDAAVEGSINCIAAAQSTDPSDNLNANAIAQLSDEYLMSSNSMTISEYYNVLISDIGIESSSASLQYDQSEAMVQQLENYRESVVGVSIEEEMTNLTRYQQAYQAASQVLNTAAELVDIVMTINQ